MKLTFKTKDNHLHDGARIRLKEQTFLRGDISSRCVGPKFAYLHSIEIVFLNSTARVTRHNCAPLTIISLLTNRLHQKFKTKNGKNRSQIKLH